MHVKKDTDSVVIFEKVDSGSVENRANSHLEGIDYHFDPQVNSVLGTLAQQNLKLS